MDSRYSRNIPAISREDQAKLRASKVLVLGCGGLGGYIIENLLRMGVGHITAVDGDSFDETNLNRQLLSTEVGIGRGKAVAAAQRAKEINSQVEFTAVSEFFCKENAEDLIKGQHVVMDALDNIPDRLLLEDICAKLDVPFIHGAVNGWTLQTGLVKPGGRLMHILYAAPAESTQKSTLPMTAQTCAALQCAEAVKLLCGRRTTTENSLIVGDLQNLQLEHLCF